MPERARAAKARRPQAAPLSAALAARVAGSAGLMFGTLAAEGQSMGWTELFDGSLDGWTIEDTAHDNFTVSDGVLVVAAPEGWLKSAESYADFELEVEFRFMTDDADSGVFIRAAGQEAFRRGWPNRSYQVQLRNPLGESPFAPVGGIFRHGMPDGRTDYDESLARRTSRPTGEWQTLHVRLEGESLAVSLNGVPITHAEGIGNETGFIGLQGETGSLEFRSLRLRVL
jgi:hypothetical protein